MVGESLTQFGGTVRRGAERARAARGRACFQPGFAGSAHVVGPAGELGRLRYEPAVAAPTEVWERCPVHMAMAKAGHALSAVCVAAMGGSHPLARGGGAPPGGAGGRRGPPGPRRGA